MKNQPKTKIKPRQVTLSNYEWNLVHKALLIQSFRNDAYEIYLKKYLKLTKKLEKQLEY